MKAPPTMRGNLVALVLLAVVCVYSQSTAARSAKSITPGDARATADDHVRYWEARVGESPLLYAGWAQLGRSYLDRARKTHDPKWLAKAREAERRSLAIQETFEAYVAMTAIQNYSHRFEDALQWAGKAMEASTNGWVIPDPSIVSSIVEARVGLGQLDEARKVLPADGAAPTRFYLAAAWAQWMNAAEQHEAAASMFKQAAALARKEGSETMSAWAIVAAAGALLDGARIGQAKVLLDQAAASGGQEGAALGVHQAELAMIEGRASDALGIYEAQLAADPDPEVERLAFVAARKAHRDDRARLHFEAAETGFRAAIDAGEVYTLGALAQLYADAGVHADESRQLAERNWQYKRDRAARATYEQTHGGSQPSYEERK